TAMSTDPTTPRSAAANAAAAPGGITMNKTIRMISRRLRRSPLAVLLAALSVVALVVGAGSASAAGGPGAGGGAAGGGGVAAGGAGTAKPPPRTLAPFVEPNLPDPNFSVAPTGIHGFSELGFLQHAAVDGAGCASGTPPANFGGTAVINGITITVPCNMTIQMPANTFT